MINQKQRPFKSYSCNTRHKQTGRERIARERARGNFCQPSGPWD